MRHIKSLVILGVVTVAAVVAAAWYSQDTDTIPKRGELVFPGLLAKVNDAAEIEATSKGETFTLRLADGGWVMPEKSSYPVHADKVHQLVVGTADLKRLEPKTSNPELYAKIGLEDPSSAESDSVQFALKDASGEALVEFVLGQNRPAKGNPALSEFYLRVPDDPQSWLVEGKLPHAKRSIDWLEKSVLSLDRERIREVRVTHPDQETVLVRKNEPSQSDFELVGVPENMEIDGQWRVNDIGRGMSDLELEDVRAEAEPLDGAATGYVLELTTFDGMRISMRTTTSGEETYARLEAEFDESLAAPPSTVEPDADTDQDESTSTSSGDAESDAESRATETLAAEVDSLNRRWQGWLYQLPKYKASYFDKRSDDLTKPVEPESGQPEDAGSS